MIQHHGDAAAYVYAGSRPSRMREPSAGRRRPLFGQARPLDPGPLPADEARPGSIPASRNRRSTSASARRLVDPLLSLWIRRETT